MIKAKFNSKEMKEIVGFVANIANQYAVDSSNSYVKVVVGKHSKIIYAHKGVYLETKINLSDTTEGEFVIEPYYLEELPSRSAETTISVDKDDEGSFKLSYANGKSKGELIIANEVDAFNKQIMDSSDFPSKFVKLNKSQLANTVNKLLYNSTDKDLDKKIGLPIKIVANGKKATVYSGDAWCALIYELELKEKSDKCDILTQGSLLKIAFGMAADEMQFASNETFTRIKCNTFDLVVPTQELQIFEPNAFYESQGKAKSSVTFNMSELIGGLEDVLNISRIANIDSKVDISVKGDKIIISNKANVGKAKSVVKGKSKKDFDISIYTDWITNFQKNFDGNTKLEVFKSAAVLTSEDSKVTGIIPIIDG